MGMHRLAAAKSQSETETGLTVNWRGVVGAVPGTGHQAAAATATAAAKVCEKEKQWVSGLGDTGFVYQMQQQTIENVDANGPKMQHIKKYKMDNNNNNMCT